MHNICIVTLFKAINSGSFLQAKALGLALEKQGINVFYYDIPYSKIKKIKIYLLAFKLLINEGIVSAIKYIKSLNEFKKAQQGLSVMADDKLWKIDCFVLGSDTIWNVNSHTIRDNYEVFWGTKFSKNKKRIITYAGSVADSPNNKFADSKYSEAVSLWDSISVRDMHTKSIIESMTDKSVYTVCDPTFLLYKQDYQQIIGENVQKEGYIFVYLFNPMTEKQIMDLRNYARLNRLKIYQGMSNGRLNGVDDTVINSPYSFLKYMMNASYIVTDTFHGAAFSINLEKQFIVINRGRNKVNSLLFDLRFEDRLIEKGQLFTSLMVDPIDYSIRMSKLDELRESSFGYLKDALGE